MPFSVCGQVSLTGILGAHIPACCGRSRSIGRTVSVFARTLPGTSSSRPSPTILLSLRRAHCSQEKHRPALHLDRLPAPSHKNLVLGCCIMVRSSKSSVSTSCSIALRLVLFDSRDMLRVPTVPEREMPGTSSPMCQSNGEPDSSRNFTIK